VAWGSTDLFGADDVNKQVLASDVIRVEPVSVRSMGKTNKKRKFTKKVSRKPKKLIPKFVYPQQPELQRLWDENKT
jgi:hypothetical protein